MPWWGWAVVAGLWLVLLAIGLALMRSAADGDRMAERHWHERYREDEMGRMRLRHDDLQDGIFESPDDQNQRETG